MLPLVQIAAFVKEAASIAKEKRREAALYSPGVVAHEAGHAVMHRHPRRKGEKRFNVMQAAELAGAALPAAVMARKLLTGKGRERDLYDAMAVGFAPRLVDEYASSIKGHRAVKRSKAFKALSKEDLGRERNRLISAGMTYGLTPVQLAAAGRMKEGDRTNKAAVGAFVGAAAGQIGALAHTSMSKGPKITAREAKALAQEMAPGVNVFATKEPFAGGSAYLPPSKSKFMRTVVNEQLKPYADAKTRKKLVSEGGLMIAPMGQGTLAKALFGAGKMDDKFKEVN